MGPQTGGLSLAADGLPDAWPQDHGVPTIGPDVLAWAETELVQPDGDDAGAPWRWRQSQARFACWWYALDDQGVWLFRRAQVVLPKGAGKTPLAAALSCCELAGPVRFAGWDDGVPLAAPPPSPWVQLAAVSQDQTDNTMSLVLAMLRGPATRSVKGLDMGLTRVRTTNGILQPVTASAPSREGQRSTAAILDEALALDTPLPTPSGWTTIEKVQSGDWLYGSDGQPVQVVKTTEVQNDRACYRVSFADGTSVVTSDGHLWTARPVKARASSMKEWTTGEMAARGGRFRVPLTEALAGVAAELPVDPYCLGAWLGDGSTGQQYITAAEEDAEEMATQLRAGGFLGVVHRPRERACRIALSNRAGFQGANRTPAAQALYAMPCFRDKHIPEEYLLADREQRTALLQGLMDTDGHVGKDGYCTFVGTDQLADGVIQLLRGLGQVPMRRWVADVRSRHGGYVKVHFAPRGGLVPFRLARKVARVRQSPERGVTIVSVEPVESVPVKCVAVDSSDHLFAIGDGHALTHNTQLWTRENGGQRLAATIRRNLAKMRGRSIETTNTWTPGAGSVAQATSEYADKVREGAVRDSGVLRWHPSVDVADLTDGPALRAGLESLYADSPWIDVDRVIAEIMDLGTAPADARRYYLNQVSTTDDAWISRPEWAARVDAAKVVGPGEPVVLGFDGSRGRARGVTDATALVGCRVADGHLFEVGVWEQPEGARDWRVPADEVDAAVRQCFAALNVIGFYADPAKWETRVAAWEAAHTSRLQVRATRDHPVEWWMTGGRSSLVVRALEQFRAAVVEGEMTHDGSWALTRHVLNARRRPSRSGLQIAKEHPDSARKIDAAVAATLAWQARLDALSSGAGATRPRSKTLIRF